MSWDDTSEMTAHARRQAELILAHGQPVVVTDKELALRLIGVDADPQFVVAYKYRDQDAADAWQRSTLRFSYVPSLGTAPVHDGVIGVYDLRPDVRRD